MADDIKVTPGVESLSYESKDSINGGKYKIDSTLNSNIQVKYNWKVFKRNKISFLYKGESLYLGNAIPNDYTYLNTFQIGQHLYSGRNDWSYHIGATERFYLMYLNNQQVLQKVYAPMVTIGLNHAFAKLDEHALGFDAKVSYFNGMKQKIGESTQVEDGGSVLAGFTATKYYKRFYYRVYVQGGIDYQQTSSTKDELTRYYLGVDFNYKF